MLDSINKQDELYVLKEGHGYSCLGFEVCQGRTQRLIDWIHTLPEHKNFQVAEAPVGTEEHYTRYRKVLEFANKVCQEKKIRCPVELTEQLIGLEGRRVEVVDCYGDTRRFIVGKSMGWMPVHLEISKSNSSGGPAVMGTPFKSIKVVK